jgi:hypothetical protein
MLKWMMVMFADPDGTDEVMIKAMAVVEGVCW